MININTQIVCTNIYMVMILNHLYPSSVDKRTYINSVRIVAETNKCVNLLNCFYTHNIFVF